MRQTAAGSCRCNTIRSTASRLRPSLSDPEEESAQAGEGWNMEYGIWNMEYGKKLAATVEGRGDGV